jgi:hypothetical protein
MAGSRDHAKKAEREARRLAGAMALGLGIFGEALQKANKETEGSEGGADPTHRGSPPEPEAGLHGGCGRNTQESTMENWRIETATELDLPSSLRARCGNAPW